MVGRHPPGNQPETRQTQSDEMRSRDLRTLLARPASMDPRENKRGDWPCCEETEARIDYVGPAPQHKGDWSYRFRSVRRSPPSVSPSMSPLISLLVSFSFPLLGRCRGSCRRHLFRRLLGTTPTNATPRFPLTSSKQPLNIKRQRSVSPLWRRTIAR